MERARAAACAPATGRSDARSLYALGSVYSESGKSAEAVVVLKRALELSPHSDEALSPARRGVPGAGQRNEAIDNLRKAVEVNPYFWVNHNVLGDAYLHFGDTEKSLEEFRRVTELEPKNPVGYNNIGSAYFARGEWEKGIPAYEQSLKLQPHWLTYSSLGTAYFYLKRYPDAVKVFEQAAALNPNDAITMGNLADGLRWSGQRDRALTLYVTAICACLQGSAGQPEGRDDAGDGGAVSGQERQRWPRDGVHQKGPRGRPVERGAPLLRGRRAHAGRPQRCRAGVAEKALDGGYSAREAAEDPELAVLGKSPAFARMLRR